MSSHVADLYQRREIRLGEQNVLHEALLVASGEIGAEVQAQLLEWLLAPASPPSLALVLCLVLIFFFRLPFIWNHNRLFFLLFLQFSGNL